jgi:predicted esterase
MMKRLWTGCLENIKGGGSMQYRKYGVLFAIFLMFTALLTGCSSNPREEQISSSRAEIVTETVEKRQTATKESVTEAIADPEISTDTPEGYIRTGYKADTKVWDVIDDPAFAGYGRLIFPADRSIEKSMTLSEVGSILPYYTYVNTDRTVEIVNYLKTKAEAGEQIFYAIYTDEEKAADPAKENTGLFFFRGNPGEKFAIVNAGGAFVYVGAMHDSFPHALELSKKGYNAFALIYRPGADTASEDLARAIAFVHEHADELEVDTADYSLWGGSAGARMAAWLGSNGTAAYGEAEYPRPAAVILQYTGLTEVNGNEPPTYACVGTSDGIANYRIMENRINQIKANGTDAEIEIFDHLPHGFGLGEGTIAEGWIDHAVKFWENQMK